MAKVKRTYSIESEIINNTNTFNTIKEAKEAIVSAMEGNKILEEDNDQIGAIIGTLDKEQVNCTLIRIEDGEVKFGRTTKIQAPAKEEVAAAKEEDEVETADENPLHFFSPEEIAEVQNTESTEEN